MRIFVADDSAAIQKVVRLAFTGYDCEILEAESAVSLASMLRQTPPDVVLADPKLAGIDGPESLKKILGTTKVILLLGSYESIDENLWRDHGFGETIKKPFVGKVLTEAVARLCPHIKQIPSKDQPFSGSFAGEPTRTNQMAMTTLDIDLDFLQQPDDSDVQLDVSIPQPEVQVKDRGKKAFEEDRGISTLDLGSHEPPNVTLEPKIAAEFQHASKGNLTAKHPTEPSPKGAFHLDLELDGEPIKPQTREEKVHFSKPEHGSTPGKAGNLREVTEPVAASQPREVRQHRASPQPLESSKPESAAANLDPDSLLRPYWPRIQELIRIEIRQYLDLHFKAQIPGIAKEVIAAEIRRLSEEKARINIDN
ncbi:MAG: response regulator [Pseudomonadota bacterium]